MFATGPFILGVGHTVKTALMINIEASIDIARSRNAKDLPPSNSKSRITGQNKIRPKHRLLFSSLIQRPRKCREIFYTKKSMQRKLTIVIVKHKSSTSNNFFLDSQGLAVFKNRHNVMRLF